MILSLIIKGIFLYEIYLDKNQNSMFIVAFFASFLMSPAVVFSYASNNFFGHFKELWFGSRIYSNDSKMAFKLYLQSLLLPLVIDFAFTMIILAIAIYIGLLTPVWILCYFAQMILFVYLGFVISILKPIKITDRMSSSFRRTTSQLYSSLLLVFVIITGGIMYMYWYWALLFVVPVAAVIHYKAPSFYEANRHKIYSIIF